MSSKIRLTRICKFCGVEFEAKTTVTKYCSLKCAQRAYKQKVKTDKVSLSNAETQEVRQKPIEIIKAKEYLSVAETCKLLGLSRTTFYRTVKRGQIAVLRIGKRVIIQQGELNKFLNKLKTKNKVG